MSQVQQLPARLLPDQGVEQANVNHYNIGGNLFRDQYVVMFQTQDKRWSGTYRLEKWSDADGTNRPIYDYHFSKAAVWQWMKLENGPTEPFHLCFPCQEGGYTVLTVIIHQGEVWTPSERDRPARSVETLPTDLPCYLIVV